MWSPIAGGTDIVPRKRADLLHVAFLLGLAGKALLGLSQIAGGLTLVVSPPDALPHLVDWLARNELAEDPSDPLALWVERGLSHASFAAGGFYVVYLLAHGGMNVAMAAALATRRPWGYPLALLFLGAFIALQLFEYARTADPVLLLLSGYDILIVLLVLREWRRAQA